MKSSPVTTPAAPIRPTKRSATKSSAVTAGELGVEVEHEHRVGAGRGEQPLALVERGQPEGRHVGLEEAHRMGIEGRDQHRPPLGAGALDRAAHHRLVARVKSIEIAERDDAAAKPLRNRRAAVQPLHRRSIGKPRPPA